MNQRFITRVLLACGVIGPLLFIIMFLIEGATRPGYSAWRHAPARRDHQRLWLDHASCAPTYAPREAGGSFTLRKP
jgi:hypothetical protein